MSSKAPETLTEAQSLPEIEQQAPHIKDWSVPVYLFLDAGNRLMEVVKDITNESFLKREFQ